MKFKKTFVINLIIWTLMVLNSLYMMYSTYAGNDFALQNNGVLFAKILIGEAIVLFVIFFGVERFLFRKSRVQKHCDRAPNRLIIPFYIITILGLVFAQASIIWGGAAYKASGEHLFLYILFGIGIVFILYSFPWKFRVFRK